LASRRSLSRKLTLISMREFQNSDQDDLAAIVRLFQQEGTAGLQTVLRLQFLIV
jgi:hypothetical protein